MYARAGAYMGDWGGIRPRPVCRSRRVARSSSSGTVASFDRTVIVKAETGARPPSEDMASRIAEMFPDLCNGLYVRLASIARKSNGPIPGWFADWVEIEAKAAILRWWEPLLIPGLLQTEDYARGPVDLAQGQRG
jgi:hypothetical protein